MFTPSWGTASTFKRGGAAGLLDVTDPLWGHWVLLAKRLLLGFHLLSFGGEWGTGSKVGRRHSLAVCAGPEALRLEGLTHGVAGGRQEMGTAGGKGLTKNSHHCLQGKLDADTMNQETRPFPECRAGRKGKGEKEEKDLVVC